MSDPDDDQRRSNWDEACATMCDVDGRITDVMRAQYFQICRFWCHRCRVMWTGSWAVSGRYPQPIAEMRHSCGELMARTEGDERFDPRQKESP